MAGFGSGQRRASSRRAPSATARASAAACDSIAVVAMSAPSSSWVKRACTPTATQIVVSASATPTVIPPVKVPSSCQHGASTAVSVAASASGGDRRGVSSETLSAR
jgi:hypothetical protein